MSWREARGKSAFKLYEPHLKKMIEIKKQIAEKIGYDKHPYDALLDTFEEELTVDDLDRVFGALTPRIQNILKKLVDSGSPFCKERKLGESKYDIQKVDELNHDILTLMQYDMKRFRMDVSSHCLLLLLKADLRLRSMNLSQGIGRILWAEACLLFN